MSGFEELAALATFRPVSSWPGARAQETESSPFTAGWGDTVALLVKELSMLEAEQVVVEVDGLREQDLRLDGLPRANSRPGRGVVVSFGSKHGPLRYACDRFEAASWRRRLDDWQHNMRAIALGLEALRKVERYGIAQRGEQYRGYLALEAGGGESTGMTLSDAAEWMAEHLEDVTAHDVLRAADDPSGDWWERVQRKVKFATHPDRHGGGQKPWDRTMAAIAVIERSR